jgi:hypothetical protein
MAGLSLSAVSGVTSTGIEPESIFGAATSGVEFVAVKVLHFLSNMNSF